MAPRTQRFASVGYALAAFVVLGGLMVACGDDDSADEAAPTTQSAPTTEETPSTVEEPAATTTTTAVTTDDVTSIELPAEVVEAYDNYGEAVLAADGDAMLEFVTDDFTWLSYGTNLMDAEYRADYVTQFYGSFEVEAIGEPTVVGGGDEYIFSTPERATTPAVADGISVVKMVKVDDTWLVSAHRFLGEGEGSG